MNSPAILDQAVETLPSSDRLEAVARKRAQPQILDRYPNCGSRDSRRPGDEPKRRGLLQCCIATVRG